MSLVLIHPAPDALWADARLAGVLRRALGERQAPVRTRAEELDGLEGRKLLFALPLDEGGELAYFRCWPACAGRQTCWRAAPAA